MTEKYEIVPIDIVEPNDWNPNQLLWIWFEKLVKALDKSEWNYLQPIIVRKHPNKEWMLQIVDWEHRYRAMLENWFSDIVVKIEALSDKDAKLKTIKMNKFRWEFDAMWLAKLLLELRDNFWVSVSELQNELWYSQSELDSYIHLVQFDTKTFDTSFDKLKPEEPASQPLEQKTNIILDVTKEEADILKQVKKDMFLDSDNDALALLAKYVTKLIENWMITPQEIRDLFTNEDIWMKELWI